MSIFEQIIATIAPHACIRCGREGSVMCSACMELLREVPPRCYRCKRLGEGFATCKSCYSPARPRAVFVATHYEDDAKELVRVFKFDRAQSAAKDIAGHMAPLLSAMSQNVVLVPVPTATSRMRKRGYDHARLLAREISKQTGIPRIDLLARAGQQHQVGASGKVRREQLEQAFWVRSPLLAQSQKHVILVDDVLTTGATLEAATKALKAVGVKRVDAIVFAQA